MDGVIPIVVISLGLICASFTDFTRFKVHNKLTFPLFFGGLAYGAITNQWEGLGFSLLGALTGLGILLLPYLMGGLGAGDVKFVMAMGTWLGPGLLLPGILIGCAALFIYYLAIVARRKGVAGLTEQIQLMFFRLSCFGRNLAMNDQFESVQSASRSESSVNRGRLIPFSAMMSVGIILAIIIGQLVR